MALDGCPVRVLESFPNRLIVATTTEWAGRPADTRLTIGPAEYLAK